MANNNKIIEEAEYYLQNDVTMKTAADHFGISKKTFQIHMKMLDGIDIDKYKLVEDRKLANRISGNIKGGQNGKPTVFPNKPRKHSISDEEIDALAKKIIYEGLSLREIEIITGIPKSTLLDNLTEDKVEDYEKLRKELESHKPENKSK